MSGRDSFRVLVSIAAFFALLVAPYHAQEALLYEENFEDEQAQGWELETGWVVDARTLNGKGHSWARYTRDSWDDASVYCRLESNGVHVNVRYSDTGRYFIGFREQDGTLSLYLSKQLWPDKFFDLASENTEYDATEVHLVGISTTGGHIQVTVDGTLVLDYTDPDPLPAGSIAFETLDDTYAQVDDIVVYGPVTPPAPTNTAPQVFIDANPLSGRTPLPVYFSGERSFDEDGSIDSYQWDFADGTSAKGDGVDHTYIRSGDYRATLTVTDNDGQSATASVTIRVENTPPVADASANPASGSAPLTVNFDASQSYDPDGSIVSYRWDFGDGVREQTPMANHQYRNPKYYTAVLTVTDDEGMTGRDVVGITVENAPPIAYFTVSPHKGTVPLTIELDGSQSYDPNGDDLTFSWDFGDEEFGSGMMTKHTYKIEGNYQLSLLVTDSHKASNRAETTVEVEPLIEEELPIEEERSTEGESFPWKPVSTVVFGIIAVSAIILRIIRTPRSKVEFPKPQIHIDSGAECSAGKESNLPEISVHIRSGIWKDGDER